MKKHQHVAAHCKICSYSEHNLSWIDQLVVRGDSTLKNILMNLENCDGPLLEYFYGSAFERLDANASANILGLWIEAMGSEVWLGIMNTHSKEFPSHDPQDILYYILRGNHGEKLPFKNLLEALRFARIEESDRVGVEMRLLMCEIEMWRKLGH
ncbi:unnamed protein product [Penicillium nalgiovense]|uniref:Uncharacterized protein n=3 Tax=Penicillium TaxID=5073 RepID=A0A9W4MPZ8_PENNA|nr:unnamed protein product [Penicillium nalgiovense]CAG7952183.1 unnamed protein product [Penicillium salamii]CAG7939747.1 unnamed protein product [Penicillium nalgiovense]CAG7966767.1 unnamed protein product [Penicillium salamii]CAG8018947.1 unnamed protein product [Penicillium nalgiovense]